MPVTEYRKKENGGRDKEKKEGFFSVNTSSRFLSSQLSASTPSLEISPHRTIPSKKEQSPAFQQQVSPAPTWNPPDVA